jgi:MFS family permease
MAIAVHTWPARLVARPWLLAFVPVNAATAGFGVLLPLLILIPLHGNWADVATAATVFNGAVILSSVGWGHLADRYPARRAFLVVTYGGYAALYLVLSHIDSLPVLYVVYGTIGAISPAAANAANLLILERFGSGERATGFASFQEMSMIGSVVGLLVGFLWTTANDALLSLIYVLAALAAVSAVALWFGVREALRPERARSLAQHPESLIARLRVSASYRIPIPFFPRRPRIRPGALSRFRLWAKEELHHELPLVMGAMFLFNLASNLYNISYTPFLYSLGLGAASIFLVNLSNNFTQTLLFPVSGKWSNRFGVDRLVRASSYLRALGYLGTAGFTFVALVAPGAFLANFLVFGILGGAIALYTTASSLMLFRGLERRDAGGLLGVNSALGGGAAVLGAGMSGVLALFGSYRLVFLVAAGALLVSVPLWAAASVAYRRRVQGEAARSPVGPTPREVRGRPVEAPVAAKTP